MKHDMKYVEEDISDSVRYLKLEDVILNLTNLAKVRPLDSRFDVETYEEYGGTSCRVILSYERPKTEQEIAKEYLDKRRQDDYRRQQYEQLRKEFEK